MKKTVIASVIVIVFIVGLIWWGKLAQKSNINAFEPGASHPARTGSALSTLETFYDFGRISMKNGNVSQVFKVANTSSNDINLSKLYTSCMCTTSYFIRGDESKKGPFGMPGHGGAVPKLNEVIKAGEEIEIEIIYDPNAHGPAGVGLIERSVFLEEENGKTIEFKFKANVTP